MPAPAEAPAPLPWVNPARCLSPCDRHPGPALVRVNEDGAPAEGGPHLVSREVIAPLAELMAAARAAGHSLRVNSAFRSYEEQAALFRQVKQPGRAARPGHSEHQLGTAVDLDLPTPEAKAWLAEQAPAFGFTLSYPADKQRLTGYRPEPWHLRFVGRPLAGDLARQGLALEEHFRSHPAAGISGDCGDCPAPASRAGCGRVGARGVCRGPILTWCYEGALAAIDCSAFGKQCQPGGAGAPPDCR
jgi:D-alanyl-D-alanine carboxypeptidase